MPEMNMQPQGQPQLPQYPMMGDGMMPQEPNGNPMDDEGMPQDTNMGMENQFDNNFDAGVEADEDEDPENYIKQLTGKLAQKLRSFNNDNGQNDESLNKYAAKMVIKAAADGMSPEGRTELKKAVNTAKGNEDDMEDTSSDGSDEMQDDGSMNMDDGSQQMPMNERIYTKKNIAEALKNLDGVITKEKKQKIDKSKKLSSDNIYSGYKNK